MSTFNRENFTQKTADAAVIDMSDRELGKAIMTPPGVPTAIKVTDEAPEGMKAAKPSGPEALPTSSPVVELKEGEKNGPK